MSIFVSYIVSMVFLFALSPPQVLCDEDIHESGPGIRCGNLSSHEEPGHLNNDNAAEYHQHCVHCLFPQNCLDDNLCLVGTKGSTCEKCANSKTPMTGYYRVGNVCTKCPDVAWPAVSFGVYLLLFIVMAFYHGLTPSVSTKLKLLCHFLQLLVLALHIKVDWPVVIVRVIGILNLAEFNSNIVVPECAFPKLQPKFRHYARWLTSLTIPLLVFMLGTFIDRSMKKIFNKNKVGGFNSAAQTVQTQTHRTPLRRFMFLVVMVMYMPVSVSTIQTYLCSDTVPAKLVLDHTANVFLLDNSIPCDTFVFQTIHFVSSLYLIVYVALLPMLLVLFTLRQRKWHFLKSGRFMYGPVYESYKDRYCFWEVLPLLRKLAVCPGVHTAGYDRHISPPDHRPEALQVISNVILGLVQAVALIQIRQIVVPFLPIVTVVGIVVVVSLWLVMMLGLSCESSEDPDEDEELPGISMVIGEQEVNLPTTVRRWILPLFRPPRKVGPDPKFAKKVEENKQHINF